ncbi:hypothetical protein Tcan_18792 [Toxocara canis]|uniref:G-protein coupled receptors family 1 profile domain-containing protein n=1 Tax=Toxocara canis TaxID=6265 RepID=A0A0B2W3Y9_TOXCA|nr:hypothetical protein Tcan_18792 [Toxocara canis]
MVLDDAWNRTTQTSGHAGVLPVHIVALVIGIINFLLNGFICASFRSNRHLFYKCHLYIFFAFAVTNSLSGFFTIPTIVNLFLHNNLKCPRWTIIIGSGFEIALDRMRKLLTIIIAVERLYAVYLPSNYYLMAHVKFARWCCGVAALWGLFDALAMIAEDDLFQIRMHCVTTSSSGPVFHTYFLVSSIVFGLVLLFIYVLFVVKLCLITESNGSIHGHIHPYAVKSNYRQIRMHCVTTSSSGPVFHTYFLVSSIVFGLVLLFIYVLFVVKLCLITESNGSIHGHIHPYAVKSNYRQANSLTAIVVLSVLLFSVVPCALYFYDLIENKIVFMEAGPVVTIGNHMYGCSAFFIYNWQHRDIRRAITRTARRVWRCEWNEPLTFKSAILSSNRNAKKKGIVVTLKWSASSEIL